MTVYKRLSSKIEIDLETVLLQAASALDAAGVIAERNNDVEGLLNVSAFWMKFGDTLQEATASVVEEDMLGTKKFETGFQRIMVTEAAESDEEVDDD
jgi:hypothetical protein